MEIFQNAFSKVLADGTECYIFEENRDEPIFTYGEPWKYKTSNSLKSGYISKGVYSIWNEFEEYHISIVLVSKKYGIGRQYVFNICLDVSFNYMLYFYYMDGAGSGN